MIATLTQSSSTSTSPGGQDVNAAGAPLPRIPRRSSSSSIPRPNSSLLSSPVIQIQQASPPQPSTHQLSSLAASASALEISEDEVERPIAAVQFPSVDHLDPSASNLRARRLRTRLAESEAEQHDGLVTKSHPRSQLPPEFLAPQSTSLSLDSITPVQASTSTISLPVPAPAITASASYSGPPTTIGPSAIVYTKSGRPVKSSLKSRRNSDRGSLTVLTGALPLAKSEPATPKAVHFDSQLEHVKLFLSAQRPRAVSRSGSPEHGDTSGTDSDFPFENTTPSAAVWNANAKDRKLMMKVLNMPDAVNRTKDLAMRELRLSRDESSIQGSVRVRNLAFQKYVVARFTFDSWATTSEVQARYSDSEGSDFDVFSFQIKIGDLVDRIESKKLKLCVWYKVHGKEIWDNNEGKNYEATFSRATLPPPPSPSVAIGGGRQLPRLKPKKFVYSSDDDSGINSDDLRDRLEKVVQENSVNPVKPRFLRRGSNSTSTPTISTNPALLDVKTGEKSSRSPSPSPSPVFGARYEFDLKRPWSGGPLGQHHRFPTYPSGASSFGSSIPFPSGSPVSAKAPSVPPRANVSSPIPGSASTSTEGGRSRSSSTSSMGSARNHQRGYFDQTYDVAPAASTDENTVTPTNATTPESGMKVKMTAFTGAIPPASLAAFDDEAEKPRRNSDTISDSPSPRFFVSSSSSSSSLAPRLSISAPDPQPALSKLSVSSLLRSSTAAFDGSLGTDLDGEEVELGLEVEDGMDLEDMDSQNVRLERTVSEDSTPSMVSPGTTSSSESSSRSASPSVPVPRGYSMHGEGEVQGGAGVSPNTSYRHFVNKFCFFTGAGDIGFVSPTAEHPSDSHAILPSSSSASSTATFTPSSLGGVDGGILAQAPSASSYVNPLHELATLRSQSVTPKAPAFD